MWSGVPPRHLALRSSCPGGHLARRVSVVLSCVRMYPHLPLERTMGFFMLWWLGEVSNFPQGPREAPPTPYAFGVLVLYFGLILLIRGIYIYMFVCVCVCVLFYILIIKEQVTSHSSMNSRFCFIRRVYGPLIGPKRFSKYDKLAPPGRSRAGSGRARPAPAAPGGTDSLSCALRRAAARAHTLPTRRTTHTHSLKAHTTLRPAPARSPCNECND
jgi:hypothetical protein